VLDYKTGTVKDGGGNAWLDAAVFERLTACAPGSPEAATLLAELAETGLDVQLPLYLFLLDASGPQLPDNAAPNNAAWVALKSDGGERPFFPDEAGPEERALVIRQRVPALVTFLLEHLLAAPEYPARSGKHCQWCDYQGPCCS
jgi:hypothetical protein